MVGEAVSFWPVTLTDVSTIAANAAVVAGALYAGFKAIPGLAAALKTIARRDVASAATDEVDRGRADKETQSSSELDAFNDRRVGAVFALFERWKAVRPDLAGGVRAGLFTPPYQTFVDRMLAFFDLMLVDLPASRADHWRQVMLGELVKHARILKSHYLGKRAAEFSPALRELIGEAIAIA